MIFILQLPNGTLIRCLSAEDAQSRASFFLWLLEAERERADCDSGESVALSLVAPDAGLAPPSGLARRHGRREGCRQGGAAGLRLDALEGCSGRVDEMPTKARQRCDIAIGDRRELDRVFPGRPAPIRCGESGPGGFIQVIRCRGSPT